MIRGARPKLLLRNNKTGGWEVYDINNNQLRAAFIGTVGLDWQFAGIAPIHAAGASDLVLRNVMAGFIGDAADDCIFLGDDTPQQMSLTTPQHA